MADILQRKHYLWWFLAFLAIAIYGSLVPFRFTPIPWGEAVERFAAIPFLQLGIESRSDFVANILLFMPLGFCGLAMFVVDRPSLGHTLFWALIVCVCLCALSVAIEFTQIFFPPRTVSQNDIFAETAGGIIGVTVYLLLGQRLTNWARRLWNAWDRGNLVTTLLPGYLLFLGIIHVMPLDLTISPVEVWHKYKEGRVVLVPFSTGGWIEIGHKLFLQFVYYAPLGVLLALLPDRYRVRLQSWTRVLLVGLVVAGFNEFLQIFVFTRSAETTDVLTGGVSVLACWAMGRLLMRSGWLASPPGFVKWLALGIWMVVAAIVEWQPFHLNLDAAYLQARLNAVNPLPFADYYAGTDYNSFDQFLHKTLLFFPLGVLLTVAWRMRILLTVLVAGLTAALLEAGQLALPGRFTSVSDALVLTFGAWAGALVARRFMRKGKVIPPQWPR